MKMARHVGVRATAQAIGRVTWLGDEVALVSGDWSTADLQVSFYF
jgi:ethanolamine utilization microcompartment shell protein EutS